jgi:hypothetical protein
MFHSARSFPAGSANPLTVVGVTARGAGPLDLAGFRPYGGRPIANFFAFGEVECILDINDKITGHAFDLRVAEQDLNGVRAASRSSN